MFRKIDRTELDMNTFTAIGNDWMLISAKKKDKVNTMTASWGEMGHLWNHDVVTVFIRQSRYTKEFVDTSKSFSLSFFEDHKKELGYLGKVSGRNEDKIAAVNFHPVEIDGIPTFEEAKLVMTVETLYTEDIKEENFLDHALWDRWYADNDFHTIYIAKVTGIYINE